ncbi:cytochrome C oxidase subunit IV family protein [Paludisphaera mucosa]|uniref:Caa(3)-type oxidase subunit IV n=1 Tax=Paludisphaera mucosa TaxID=3030827 RepID=A0ABT6FKS3_9BACT|nr:cytochrome C oxidase subunit IV family protein [Paludisphaera mucosa]MDG3008181.1 caa(3)-type oxidase subunit IV [Paludisphaera mucosa]
MAHTSHSHSQTNLAQTTDAHAQAHHVIEVRTYVLIYIALMLFLAATVAASFMPLGAFHLPVAMTIALIKAVLIVLFFMHVYYSAPLTWITAVGSLLWVGLLLAFLLSDYLARGWLHILGK